MSLSSGDRVWSDAPGQSGAMARAMVISMKPGDVDTANLTELPSKIGCQRRVKA